MFIIHKSPVYILMKSIHICNVVKMKSQPPLQIKKKHTHTHTYIGIGIFKINLFTNINFSSLFFSEEQKKNMLYWQGTRREFDWIFFL